MCGLYREMHGPITHRRTVALKQTKARKDAVDTLSEESYNSQYLGKFIAERD